MNSISPLSYIRKQKKVLASVSLLVAGMQVFGYSTFIGNGISNPEYIIPDFHYNAKYFNDFDRLFPYNLKNTYFDPKEEEAPVVSENHPSEALSEINSEKRIPFGDENYNFLGVEISTESIVPPESISENKQGIIGKSETFPIDDPSDNTFAVILDDLPENSNEVYLVYDLFGLEDASGASVSINDQYARGGYLVKKSDKWITHKEKINPIELNQGINYIRFSTLASADYQYMVRNIRLESFATQKNTQTISLNQTELKSYDGFIYLSGFTLTSIETIKINGKEVPVKNGRFETILENTDETVEISSAEEEEEVIIAVTHKSQESPDRIAELQTDNSFAEKLFLVDSENIWSEFGASLTVPVGSMEKDTRFFLSALRYQDISVTSPEMVNVTGIHSGFRLLPHGEHFVKEPATLEIPYDETKIPAGYKPQDIKTFYFDQSQSKWIALDRDTVLLDKKVIVSKTTHFTDFINGIIKVPESPETGSFTPTSIKDIKAADPASGVVSIQPPAPNNMGNATTSFPIKLPAGRAGMQPSLSVNYNSEGGNGWMGVGWDISLPSVSIDTRWGAPRYDGEIETEIYSLGGGMLTLNNGTEYTNPHRTANIIRTSERQFYPRIEGSYAKIIRHGNKPHNYWWEVTDKMGNKSFYGGYGSAVVPNAVIRTGSNNTDPIAHWALYRTEDTNGNYVQYIYDAPTYAGTGAGNGGKEFYLSEIHYTKNDVSTSDAFYKVVFNTDGGMIRDDVQINARLGLVQTTSHLLDEIEIFYVDGINEEEIRSYHFEYQNPNFSKKQLKSIAEYDANGQLFYSNTMEYFDEVTDGDFISGYGESTCQWSTDNDNTEGGLVLPGVSGNFTDKGSILGASKGYGFSGGAAINVGLGFNIFSKMAAAGVNFGYGYSQDNGLVSFTDINGDGLPDKIIKAGNSSVKYRPNNGSGFDSLIAIDGLSDFSKSSSNTFNVGLEANFGVFLGYTYSKSKNKLKTYFADVNGDGLVDLVNNGRVSFNSNELFLDPNNPDYNIRKFNTSSGFSPNHIEAGIVSGQIQEVLQPLDEEEMLRNENPLHDVVKVWIAPRDGNYLIEPSTVTLNPLVLPDDNDEYKADYDGVIVRIEKGNNSNNDTAADVIPNTTRELTPDYDEATNTIEFEQQANIGEIQLNGMSKGQRIYFRVHSKDEGSYDRVEWEPVIHYADFIPTDANGLEYFSSSAEEGFIMSAKWGVIIPDNADVSVAFPSFSFPPYAFSDDIRFSIIIGNIDPETGEYVQVNTFPVPAYQSDPNTIDITDFHNYENYMEPGKTIWFKAESDSNIDWKKLAEMWKPKVIVEGNGTAADYEIDAIVEYGIYNKKINQVHSRMDLPLPYNRNLRFNMLYNNQPVPLELLGENVGLDPNECYKVNLVVKDLSQKVIGKKTMGAKVTFQSILGIPHVKARLFNTSSCTGTTIQPLQVPANLPTSSIFAEIYTENEVLSIIGDFQVGVYQYNTQNANFTHLWDYKDVYAKGGNTIFGPEYRNWGQFAYRSQEGGLTGINETVLKPPSTTQEEAPTQDPFGECPGEPGSNEYMLCAEEIIDNMGIQNPMDAPFIIMAPYPNKEILADEIYMDTYEGYDHDIYVEEKAFSSSRMGINNIQSLLVDFDIEPQAVPGVTIISKGEGDSEVAGAGPIGGSWSQSFNYKVNEFSDMNGDRYPDIITENKIQYTSSTGKLDEVLSFENEHEFGRVSTGENEASGSSVAGTFLFANTGSSNSLALHSIETSSANFPVIDPVTAPQPNSSASLSYNSSSGTNTEHLLWIDMNGDGLPDRVRAEASPLTVQLNLGYKFAEPQVWANTPNTLSGSSRNDSGGVGFSILNNSWGGGVSVSTSRGYTHENFVDINGDGLPDLVLNADGETIQYRLNSGNGFGNLHSISKAVAQSNRSTAEGANVAFTFGIPGLFVKVTTSINASANHSLNRIESTISDINGDGFADLLLTDSAGHDGDLSVRLNKTGKTHLLKRVNLPLGGYWEIDYEREQNTYEMPNAKWKMVSIAVHDNFTGDNAFSPDVAKTSVEYTNGKHDRREREFMGYGEVRVNQLDVKNSDAVYRYSVQEFHNNSYYLKGAVKKESLYDADGILWMSSETTYAIMARGQTDPGIVVKESDYVFNSGDFGTAVDKASLFVSPVKTIKTFTEGGNGVPVLTATEIIAFDVNGNITEFRDYGNGVSYSGGTIADSDTSDNVRSVITYSNSAPFLGLPLNIKVYENESSLKRERTADYHPGTNNLWHVITKLGNDQTATVTFEYDDENGNNYGNIQKVTHENSLADYDDENSAKFYYEYTYDDKVHTYPVTIEDAFGYSSNNTYDYRFGALVYTEDMNYMPMRTRIDDRGRVVEVTGPYELFVEGLSSSDPAWTIRFEYKGEDPVASRVAGIDYNEYVIDAKGKFEPPSSSGVKTKSIHHAITRHFDPEFRNDPEAPLTENEIYTITLIDGLGKPIQVKKSTSIKTAVTNHTGDITKTVIDARETRKWLVNGKVETDAFGRVVKTWYPILEDYNASTPFNTAALSYNATAYETGENFYTEATYDVLDRVKTTKLPGETAEMLTSYSIEAGLFKTKVVNELNQAKHSFTDVRGRTTKVVEEATGGNIETTFEYNAIGELLEVEDTDGNITKSFYDMAGRRTELRHPDNGVTKFKYDKASNLIAKETSNLLAEGNGEKIEYFYTFNRLDSIVYPKNSHNNVHFFYGQAQDASAADDFSVGRLWYQIDATGVQQFKYGRLGEVRYNLRSVAVPGDKAYWFKTEWEYDTWNRVKKITYPDEEVVTYFYNRGGELHAMTSKKGSQHTGIISQLGYDKFGQRTYLRYGNGTETEYTYEAERRRLENMTAKSNMTYGSSVNRTFINNNYTYDILSNVLSVENTAALPTTGQIGGSVLYEYGYDDLNRLTTASGVFTGRNATDDGYERQQYSLMMEYDNLHNIVSKEQLHQKAPGETGGTLTDIPATTYRLDYTYEEDDKPHAPRIIEDKPYQTSPVSDKKFKHYDYDPNGNMIAITQVTGESETVEKLRTNLWDEENRLRAVDITPDAEGVRPVAIYTYDAGGERILKHSNTSVSIYLNGKKVADTIQTDAILYPSGMLVAKLGNNGDEEQTLAYTKHYYAGTQRVSSKIGTTENLGDFLQDWFTQGTGGPVDVVGSSFGVLENAEQGVVQVYNELGIEPPTYESTPVFIPVQSFTHAGSEREIYWFHPDHLGSTSYITNVLGEVSQHMEYFAFGETFVEEHRSSNNSPYKFNGKELDEETGWYYYGARYYDARTSVWLSVDPYQYDGTYFNGFHNSGFFNHFNFASYAYCYQNPLIYIDPNGKQIDSKIAMQEGQKAMINALDGGATVEEARKVYNQTYNANLPFGNLPPEAGIIFETALGFTPLGWIIDGKDIIEAFNGGSNWDKVIAVAAIIPGVDLFKGGRKIFKGLDNIVSDANVISRKLDTPQPGGKAYDFDVDSNGSIFFKDGSSSEGWHDFIITDGGQLRIGSGHDKLSNNGVDNVIGAGQIYIDNKGKINTVNNNSGHYKPTREENIQAATILKQSGVTTNDVSAVNVQ